MRYDVTVDPKPADNRVSCPHCKAKNPKTAFCCLTCYKVMRPGFKRGWLGVRIPLSFPLLGILALFLFGIFSYAKNWVLEVDAEMTQSLVTANYHLSLMEDTYKDK